MGPYSTLVQRVLLRFSPYHAYYNRLTSLPLPCPVTVPNSSKAKQNVLIQLDQWIMFLRVNEMHRIL
jgi:hypothetical protein